MHTHLRRLGGLVAGVMLAATTVVVLPAVSASAATPLPPVQNAQGEAGDDGTLGAYEVDFDPPAPTHDSTEVLTGYEAILYTGAPGFSTVVNTESTDDVNNSFFVF